jgi:hypothetical protein
MAQRLGITTREEFHMRRAIMAGEPWARIQRTLDDVSAEYVHESIYKPLKAEFDAGKDLMAVYGSGGVPAPGDIAKALPVQSGPPPGDHDPAKDVVLPKPADPPKGTKPL